MSRGKTGKIEEPAYNFETTMREIVNDVQAKNGEHKYMELMVQLAENRDINKKDKEGKTALHHAAEAGYKEALIVAINLGADINIPDNNGKKPLDRYIEAVAGKIKNTRDFRREDENLQDIFEKIIQHRPYQKGTPDVYKEYDEFELMRKHLGSYVRENLRKSGVKVKSGMKQRVADFAHNVIGKFRKKTARTKAHEMIERLITGSRKTITQIPAKQEVQQKGLGNRPR